VVKGAVTSGLGAKNRGGGAAGAGFVSEREGSQTAASGGHALRHWHVVRMLGSKRGGDWNGVRTALPSGFMGGGF
jgi:hypothetical protein